MDRAKKIDQWDHTARILWAIINTNRSADADPVEIYDLHPYLEKPEPNEAEIRANWRMLGLVFDPGHVHRQPTQPTPP
jgi:hypothetical protein